MDVLVGYSRRVGRMGVLGIKGVCVFSPMAVSFVVVFESRMALTGESTMANAGAAGCIFRIRVLFGIEMDGTQ